MNVSIIGGGIGGLTVAIALQQKGIRAQVFEAAPQLGCVGKGIWLPTNAMLVLDRLGLGNDIAARGLALKGIEIHDLNSGLLQRIDLKTVQKKMGRTTTSILRADLQAALVTALNPGSLHLGKHCTEVKQQANNVRIIFNDNSSVTSDIVIAADGLRSKIRSSLVPDQVLRYSGQVCYLGLADYALPEASLRTVKEVWGGKSRFGYSAVAMDKVYWFAPYSAGVDSPLSDKPTSMLLERYKKFPYPVLDLIKHTADADILRVNLYDIAPLRSWHQGRVVLLGDAAHAMMPNLGQGGAQAIEDAYVLAQSLTNQPSVKTAFEMYERTRRPKATRLTRTAWWLGKVAHVHAPWQRELRNALFKMTPQQISQRQAETLYKVTF